MYIDENGNIALWAAIILVFVITAIAIATFKVATEIKCAEIEYSMKAVDFNLSEENVTIDDEKIYRNGISIGNVDGDNFEISDSYKYSRMDMKVIYKAIATHIGKPDDYKRLYYEWEAHNYGFYAFQNDGIMGKINSAYGDNSSRDLVYSCVDVNFGVEKETGIRAAVLLGLRFFGNFPLI